MTRGKSEEPETVVPLAESAELSCCRAASEHRLDGGAWVGGTSKGSYCAHAAVKSQEKTKA